MNFGCRNYLDPYVILSTLGFGVFLFNVIFNLLNAAASGRSLDVMDIDVPLQLSDVVANSKVCICTYMDPTQNRGLFDPSF